METVCLPRRLNPTCRSDRKRSDPRRILSESDIFHKKSIGSDSLLSDSFQSESDSDFVEIQRNPIKSDQIRPDFRRIPTPHRSPGIYTKQVDKSVCHKKNLHENESVKVVFQQNCIAVNMLRK